MPAGVLPISGRRGSYALLEAWLPERPPRVIGVFLLDPEAGRAWVRMRGRYEEIADPEDAEVLAGLEPYIHARIDEIGAAGLLESLEDSLSNVLRISGRREVAVDAFTRVLDRIYDEQVEKLP